jgi:hypothetical protein
MKVKPATKSTSITIRLNNGEVEQGLDALKAFAALLLNQNPKQDVIADAILSQLTGR